MPYHWMVATTPPTSARTSSVNNSDPPGQPAAARGAWRASPDRRRRRRRATSSSPSGRGAPGAAPRGSATGSPCRRPRRRRLGASPVAGAGRARPRRRRWPWSARRRRRAPPRRGRGPAAVVDDVDHDHGDVVAPAALDGQPHQLVGRLGGVGEAAQHRAMAGSGTSLNRPSRAQQVAVAVRGGRPRTRRPARSSSTPSTRVTMLRCGWTAASSGDRLPSRTRSATRLWSLVSWSSSPSRPAVARASRRRWRWPAPRRRRASTTARATTVVPMPVSSGSSDPA